jgi:guanylate kinase
VKIDRKGLMLILSSPSGAGKTTISKEVLQRDNSIEMSVSATTREKRESEEDGKDYIFIAKDKFENMVEHAEFLEHAEVFGNMYGTPRKTVYEKLDQGKDVLFDIDWQGTIQLKGRCTEDVVSIFILPPSMKELENRLRNRAQDDDSVIKNRMKKAANEISHWHIYDYVIVNEDIDASVDKIINILKAERNKRRRLLGLDDFIDGLLNREN